MALPVRGVLLLMTVVSRETPTGGSLENATLPEWSRHALVRSHVLAFPAHLTTGSYVDCSVRLGSAG
jgi:hypothetical protein